MLSRGEVSVHPPGALGVAFFMHTRADSFVGRGGDGITQLLKDAGSLNLLDGKRQRMISLEGKVFANLLEADALGRMPELLLVCCNPNQLDLLTLELTQFLENLAGRGHLSCVDDIRRRVPIMLVLPNGILMEQTVGTYEEQINESILMGRLAGMDGPMVEALLNRIVRGISLQAGGRRGFGPDTVYVLEKKGSLVLAGGGDEERARITSLLEARGYPYHHADGVPGTRIEFDKAMISIVLNVGGLIHTVSENGELLDIRMGDLCSDPTKAEFIERVTRAVFEVGQAASAYPPDASYDEVWAKHRAVIMSFAGHVTSSLKTFRDALGSGLDSVKLFSNEEWILTPLSRYAAKAGMKEAETLFKSLKRDVQSALARAIRFRDGANGSQHSGATKMQLTDQRNITVELFDAGNDKAIVVGTMLDNEHLIKLDVTIHLPDEQIVASRLKMIRVPFPVCKEVENAAERLVGLRIERGVLNEIAARIGGRVGCSHIKELATSIVYFAASNLVRRRAGIDTTNHDFMKKAPEERFILTREVLRDTCLAYCQTTSQGLDECIGIRRVGETRSNPIPLGDCEASLGEVLRTRAERFGDKVFIRRRDGDVEATMTWSQFSNNVRRIGRQLIEMGIRPGDRVGMISENRPEMFMADLAIMSIGAVTVPVFAGYPSRQVAYVLGNAQPTFVIVSGMHQLQKIERERHPSIRKYFAMDYDGDCEAWDAQDFADLLVDGGASDAEFDRRVDATRPDDLCLVMYTSGTTGPPKGVRLSHRNIISQQKAVQLIWEVSDSDVIMSYLPWHHSFGGIFERTLALYHGCEICLDDSRGRDMDRMIDNWKAFDPTLFFSVPRVHDLLMRRCRIDSDVERAVFEGRLRFVFTAGASLPAPVAQRYRDHRIPVLEGWGLTETSPSVTLTTLDGEWKSGYVGFPIPGVSIRIDDDQEILVKGPNVMSGYLDDEEATGHVLEADGWFHTGDLGEFTESGLRIFGRKDGAFKLTTGEKVHPQRIESVLVNESSYISQAVVLGTGEDFVAALIYPAMDELRKWASEHGIDCDDLITHPDVRDFFASEINRLNSFIEVKFQRIPRIVLTDREPTLGGGELTPSGKLVRKAVVATHRDLLDDLFSRKPSDRVIFVQQGQFQKA
jgi:long-subunit acyl-CoA synthetase (AMP-forming)